MLAADQRPAWVRMMIRIGEEVDGRPRLSGAMCDISRRTDEDAAALHAVLLNTELLRAVANSVNRSVLTMSGYGSMLERHLSTQGDDIGSDQALGMRGALERVTEMLRLLRPILAKRSPTDAEISAALEAIISIPADED